MKTKKIMRFVAKQNFELRQFAVYRIDNDNKNDPYRIYVYYWENENGRFKKHRKQVAHYANLQSCFYWFIQNKIDLD